MAANQATMEYLIRIRFDGSQAAQIQQAINQLKQSTKDAGGSFRNMGTAAKSAEIDIGKLAMRAIVTIPVWLALRTAMMSSLKYVDESVKSFVDLDTALKNSQNELQGMKDLPKFMAELRVEAEKTAVATGKGPAEIVETFRQFATAGLDAQTSLSGMKTAVTGSIATNGNLIDTARMLADVYNQMGDRITEVSGAQNKFNYIMSTIATLMPTNVFTIEEFNSSLKNFLGTAKATGLTLDQTFTLIATSATAMQRGSRGGTQLASAFQQVAVHAKEVRDFLGKPLTGMNQFDIFLDVLRQISTAGSEVTPKIQEIFGMRGMRVTVAEAATFKHVTDELERMSKLSPDDRMAQLMERYGTASEKMAVQWERVTQAGLDLGRTFIQGVVGGDSFSDSLKRITQSLIGMKEAVANTAEAVRVLIDAMGKIGKYSGIGGLLEGMPSNLDAYPKALPPRPGADALERALPEFEGPKYGPESMLEGFGRLVSPSNIFQLIGKSLTLRKTLDDVDSMESNLLQLEANLRTAKARKKAGLSPLQDLGTIVVDGKKALEENKVTDAKAHQLDYDDQILLIQQKMQALGYSDLTLQQLKIRMLETEKGREEDLYKARIEYVRKYNQEIIAASENLQRTLSASLSSALQGKSHFSDIFDNLQTNMREQVAGAVSDNLTEKVFTQTGFGSIFGGVTTALRHSNDPFVSKIDTAFANGANETYNAIVKGFAVGTTSINGGAASFSGAPGMGVNNNWFNRPLMSWGGVSTYVPEMGQLTARGGGSFAMAPYRPSNQRGQANITGGQALVGGMYGYSQYQSARAGGIGTGQAIGAGVLGAAGMIGAMGLMGSSGMAFGAAALTGPVGWAVVGAMIVGSMLLGTMGGKKASSTSTQTAENRVASRIDVTNKKLELINRNLLALNKTMETYILPQSAYFSSKSSLADEFAMSAKRGV